MIPAPPPVEVPESYETVDIKDVKVSHYPAGAPSATPVIIVTLNRPAKQNAYTINMMHSFEKIYPMFDVDERVKVIVLTGAGRTFCAGADLEIGFGGVNTQGRERIMDHRDSGGRLALTIHRCRKPTIVAMQGSAVGLGMTMTLPAAIRIGYSKGKYGFVFARRGITMESCSSYFLPKLIGFSNAMYLLTTGGTYPPNSPHFGSLFQEVLDSPEGVVKRALELATEIAENCSPLAGYLNRMLMWRNPDSAEGAHLVDSAVLYHMFAAPDQLEGVTAFLEKRKASFKATLEEHAPPNFPWWLNEIDVGVRPKIAKAPSKL